LFCSVLFWLEAVLCVHMTTDKDAPPPTGAKGLALMTGIGAILGIGIRSLVCRSPKGSAQLGEGEGCKSREKIHFSHQPACALSSVPARAVRADVHNARYD
jgi:hypothetical protein